MTATRVEEFRKVFGEVPELTTSPTSITPEGDQHPTQFKNFILEGEVGREKGIIQTPLLPGSTYIPGSSSYLQIEYEKSYGLEVKRSMHLLNNPKKKGETRTSEIMNGQVSYNFGEVKIVYGISFQSPLDPLAEQLRDKDLFNAYIMVLPTSNNEKYPPITSASYGWRGVRIPMHAEFVNADYENALSGSYEKRADRYSSQTNHLKTYFQWEYLVGARVGITAFRDDDGYYDKSFSKETKINTQKPPVLEGEQYRAKISHSRGHHLAPLVGRLRFSRMNMKTGESWMLSVPELVDNKEFMTRLRSASFCDFFWQYPVVFCVKQSGEPRKWFATFGRNDKVY